MSTAPDDYPPASSSSSSSIWDYFNGSSSLPPLTSSLSAREQESNNNATETTSLLGGSSSTRIVPQHLKQQLDDAENNEILIMETPDFIRQALVKIDEELTKILVSYPTKQSTFVYNTAIQQNPEYIGRMKIWFLRCERFDCSKAASRLIDFLYSKLTLFGPGYVCRTNIQQSDLDKQSLEILYNGSFQFLQNVSDAGGDAKLKKSGAPRRRSLLCYYPHSCRHDIIIHNSNSINDRCLSKAWWYLILGMLEDDDQTKHKQLQRHGIIILIFHHQNVAILENQSNNPINCIRLSGRLQKEHKSDNRYENSNSTSKSTSTNTSMFSWDGLYSNVLKKLPIRIRVVHDCFPSKKMNITSLYPYYSYYYHAYFGNGENNDADVSEEYQRATSSFNTTTTSDASTTGAKIHYHIGMYSFLISFSSPRVDMKFVLLCVLYLFLFLLTIGHD